MFQLLVSVDVLTERPSIRGFDIASLKEVASHETDLSEQSKTVRACGLAYEQNRPPAQMLEVTLRH